MITGDGGSDFSFDGYSETSFTEPLTAVLPIVKGGLLVADAAKRCNHPKSQLMFGA